ncbi:MAG TPA: hypothetical protein VF265_07015 [Nevskiaceae bacterium]
MDPSLRRWSVVRVRPIRSDGGEKRRIRRPRRLRLLRCLAGLCAVAAFIAAPPLLVHAASAYAILRIHLEVTAACRVDHPADLGIAAVRTRCTAGAAPPALTEVGAPVVEPPAFVLADEDYRLVSIVF